MSGIISPMGKHYSYISSKLDTAYHDAALKLGLSDSAMRILYTICLDGKSCLLSDIVSLSGISKQTINSALRKLEKENIVYVENTVGRKKRVCLTNEGKDLSERTAFKVLQIENEILNTWTEEEQQLYLELTERFLTAFKLKISEL